MKWSEWTALYGAILATIIFIWNITLVIIDRPRIIVKCYEGARIKAANEKYPKGYIEMYADSPEDDVISASHGKILSSEKLIFVNASNRSRRPVTIVLWGVGYKEGGYVSASPPPEKPLPCRLEEGEGYTLWISKEEFIKEIKKHGKTPSYVFIKTADGRVFKKKGFPIKYKNT